MRSISSVSIYISYSAGSNKNLIGMPIIPFVYRLFSTLARTEHRCVAQYQSWGLAIEWGTVWSLAFYPTCPGHQLAHRPWCSSDR